MNNEEKYSRIVKKLNIPLILVGIFATIIVVVLSIFNIVTDNLISMLELSLFSFIFSPIVGLVVFINSLLRRWFSPSSSNKLGEVVGIITVFSFMIPTILAFTLR